MKDKLLNTEQAADFLGVSKSFLERDRWAGATIPCHHVGPRSPRYWLSDLVEHVDENRSHDLESQDWD